MEKHGPIFGNPFPKGPACIGTSPERALRCFEEAQKRGREGLEELLDNKQILGSTHYARMKPMIKTALAKYPPVCRAGITAVFSSSGWLYYEGEEEVVPSYANAEPSSLRSLCMRCEQQSVEEMEAGMAAMEQEMVRMMEMD